MESNALVVKSYSPNAQLSRPVDSLELAESYLAAAPWLEELCSMIEKHGFRDVSSYRWEFQRSGFNFRFSSTFDRKLNGFVSRGGKEVHAVSDTSELPHYIDGQWPEIVRREHAELEIKAKVQREIEARQGNVILILDTNAGI